MSPRNRCRWPYTAVVPLPSVRYIAEGFALAAVGLDVYAAVEVSGTHFAEVGRVKPRDAADRIYVISGVEPLALRPGADRREKQ